MFHVLFQSQIAVATGFMEETWSRNLMNVLTTPVQSSNTSSAPPSSASPRCCWRC